LTKEKVKKELKGYFFMIIGCIAYAMSTSLFLAKNQIVAGGVTGLAVLFNYINENIPIGLISIAINLPILILGVKFQGWRFIVRCLITVATLGGITDLLAYVFTNPITNDGVLASIYGGICQGIGIGLFVRYQFSSGGTELLGRLISRFVKFLSIPVCVGFLDGIIVVVGSIATNNPANMLHALIVVFLSTKLSEMILVGFEKSKLCIIISDKGEEISQILLKNSPRGITMWDGQGMYTHKNHHVLLTCVKNHQLSQLKELVNSVDPHAFIIINNSAEVRGQGFKSLQKDDEDDDN
jgi:uncharacterized membrane-anchored protein YitT (DUF2179 family)